jgi:branched-chain amino acid transport system ATP-binding protein
VLEVHDVVVRYGSIEALHGISFDIQQGEIVTLLGANGAGKSTTLRMLSGLRAPTSGSVTFEGRDITQVKAHEFSAMGISHVPEGRRIFPVMTVEENLEMGAFARRGSLGDDLDEIYTQFPILKDRRKQLGSNLSGGEQQMLAIGRALMSKPRLLLLDEPSNDDLSGRTERRAGAATGRSWLRHGERAHRVRRVRGRLVEGPASPCGLSR